MTQQSGVAFKSIFTLREMVKIGLESGADEEFSKERIMKAVEARFSKHQKN